MLRFAPSPTGDMNIDTLRVAVFNYIVSLQRDEAFIVRIEDTEKEKNIAGNDQEILDTLDLFNIEYSQVIYQSQNQRFHSAMALQLIHEKKAFSCFCSPEWLEKKHEEAIKEQKNYLYDDACRNLPAELVIDNTSPFSIRITKPDTSVIIEDELKGDIDFKSDSIDSFVIMTQDKVPLHDFSSAVDDMLSDISIVIRKEEHIDSSSRQDHVRTSLGYDKKIKYAHLPTILDDTMLSVKYLLEEGFLPEAIVNYIISIGNKTPQKIFTMKEAVKWFDLSSMSNSSVYFDIKVLREINQEHLKALDAKELSRYVGFADAEIGELARIYLQEVATTKELKAKIAPIFTIRNIPKKLEEQTKLMSKIIKIAPYFEEYEEFKNYIIKESGLTGENYSKPLRFLLTNTEEGPEIADIYKYLKNYMGEIIK